MQKGFGTYPLVRGVMKTLLAIELQKERNTQLYIIGYAVLVMR